MSDLDLDALTETLDNFNVTGWVTERGHDCDGTDEVCARRCPIPVQVQVSTRDIAAALIDQARAAQPLPEAVAAIKAEALREALLPLERYAQAQAVTQRARGGHDYERDWLDFLILLGHAADALTTDPNGDDR